MYIIMNGTSLSSTMKNDLHKPTVIEGGLATDDRGQLSFVNGFGFENIKRFYVIENFSLDTVRAWHGHMKEEKYIFVVSGSAIVGAVELDDTKNPNKENPVARFVLSARKPAMVHIPGGYANGIKSVEPGTKIIVFSTATMEESKNDDYRFPHDYWGKKAWEVEHR